LASLFEPNGQPEAKGQRGTERRGPVPNGNDADFPLAEQTRQQWQALLGSSNEGIFGMDADARCTYINERAQQLLGYTAAECIGKNMHDLTHYKRPDGSPYPIEECPIYQAFSRGQGARLISETLWRKDGSPLPALYSSAPLNLDGRLVGAVVTIVDVSDLRQAEREREELLAQLQAAEARFRGLFEGVADAILVADADGRFLDANPAAERLLGYDRGEFLKKIVADLVASTPEVAAAMYAEFERTGSWRGEVDLRRKDGATVPVEGQVTALTLPTGPLIVATLRDISERRAQERQQRDFLAMITHDLKSPLTTIRGYAQLMQRTERYDARQLQVISEQTQYLARLIDDLHALSRLEQGQLVLQREPMDLRDLVELTVAQAKLLTSQHTFVLAAPDQPVVGSWDRDRVAQVLDNLLSNAVKYSPNGGEIAIEVAMGPAAVELAVRDQGIGIPGDSLDRVFTRFYRVDAARVAGIKGSGLGLAICKGLVEAHGGAIRVESEPGRGSAFTVTLPRQT
jgi:two-component system, sensor histidine kinase and response regulator